MNFRLYNIEKGIYKSISNIGKFAIKTVETIINTTIDKRLRQLENEKWIEERELEENGMQ